MMRRALFVLCFLPFLAFSFQNEKQLKASLPTWSAEELAGQLLVVGMRSPTQIEEIKPGGVILFAWNMKTVEGTRSLGHRLKEIEEDLRLPLMIATDHEGGEVIRIRKGVTYFPDAAVVAASDDPEIAFKVGLIKGRELRSLGINTNLAPVLDLGNARSFLRNRVWGDDPEKVARLAVAYIKGLEKSGVLAVAKHFPGHGSTTTDSHFSLPVSHKSLSQMWSLDLKPFREAVKNNVPALMTAHVELPMVEKGPASFSKKMLSSLLREKMSYQGVIITDDLEMGGSQSSASSLDSAAIKALKAGSDMVMLVWSVDAQTRIRNKIAAAIKSGELKKEAIYEKIVRIWRAKNRFTLSDDDIGLTAIGSTASKKLVAEVIRAAVQWKAGEKNSITSPFKKAKGSSWQVWLPNQWSSTIWRRFRKSDQIEIFPRKSAKSLLRGIRTALGKGNPVVLVTPPRASFDDKVFGKLLSLLNEVNSKKQSVPLLWVHQGTNPIPLKHLHASQLKFGIMTLSSASRRSFNALTQYLKNEGLF